MPLSSRGRWDRFGRDSSQRSARGCAHTVALFPRGRAERRLNAGSAVGSTSSGRNIRPAASLQTESGSCSRCRRGAGTLTGNLARVAWRVFGDGWRSMRGPIPDDTQNRARSATWPNGCIISGSAVVLRRHSPAYPADSRRHWSRCPAGLGMTLAVRRIIASTSPMTARFAQRPCRAEVPSMAPDTARPIARMRSGGNGFATVLCTRAWSSPRQNVGAPENNALVLASGGGLRATTPIAPRSTLIASASGIGPIAHATRDSFVETRRRTWRSAPWTLGRTRAWISTPWGT